MIMMMMILDWKKGLLKFWRCLRMWYPEISSVRIVKTMEKAYSLLRECWMHSSSQKVRQ